MRSTPEFAASASPRSIKAHSLIRHMHRGWNFFRPERNESFDILPASQRMSESQWYAGTADAVYQNIDIIREPRAGIHRHPGRRPHLQDGLRIDAAAACRLRRRRRRSAALRCRARTRPVSASCMSMRPTTHHHPSSRSRRTHRHAGQPGDVAGQHGDLCLRHPFPLRSTASAMPPTSNSSRDFGKDIIPYIVKHGKAVAHHFSRSCVRSGRTRFRPIGAMSERSTPIGKPISI